MWFYGGPSYFAEGFQVFLLGELLLIMIPSGLDSSRILLVELFAAVGVACTGFRVGAATDEDRIDAVFMTGEVGSGYGFIISLAG